MNGILPVDKPAGWTSNDVVQKLRGILHERRIGHAGTLDPLATGLLTVFVGRATKGVQFAEADRKRYTASMRLGLVTDTLDITGEVLEEHAADVTEEQFLRILKQFLGRQTQIPPMYSAVKVNGERLYRLARRGQEVERTPREIEIYSLELISYRPDEIILDVSCSKGTYIRSLCHDIGARLGCGASMTALRRTESGIFRAEDSYSLEQIAAGEYKLTPLDALFAAHPAAVLPEADAKCLRLGQPLHTKLGDGTYRLYSKEGEFLALGIVDSKAGGLSELHVLKRFYEVDK